MIEPTLIGYFAKPTLKKANWPKSDRVEEIASFSTCLSDCDWDWINEWQHNDLWVFDSPDLAMGVVPEDKRVSCDLYAYRIFPIRYVKGRTEEFAIPPVEPIPLDDTFDRLGVDIVSRYCGDCFECLRRSALARWLDYWPIRFLCCLLRSSPQRRTERAVYSGSVAEIAYGCPVNTTLIRFISADIF